MSEHQRKVQSGVVISNKMSKTVIVSVGRRAMDKRFKKYLNKESRFKVHDEKNESKVGDLVEIVESKPISREKRWRLQKILIKAERVEGIIA